MTASVSVVNRQVVVEVRNLDNGSVAVVEATGGASVSVSGMGVRGVQGPQGPVGPQGPQGPAGSLENGFVIDGGNF